MAENSKQAIGLHEFNPLDHKVQLEYMLLSDDQRQKFLFELREKKTFWEKLQGYSKIGLYNAAADVLISDLTVLGRKIEELEDIAEFILEDDPLLFVENLVNYSVFYANYFDVFYEQIEKCPYQKVIENSSYILRKLSNQFLRDCKSDELTSDSEKILVNLYEGTFILNRHLEILYEKENPEESGEIIKMKKQFEKFFDNKEKIQEITKYATERGCENFLKALNEYTSNT